MVLSDVVVSIVVLSDVVVSISESVVATVATKLQEYKMVLISAQLTPSFVLHTHLELEPWKKATLLGDALLPRSGRLH